MTVSTTIAKSGPYDADGATTVFARGFRIDDASELKVYQYDTNDAETEITSGFTVEGVGSDSGNVTFTTAPANNNKILLVRQSSTAQGTNYNNQQSVPTELVESDLDRVSKNVQELTDKVDRALKLPRKSTGNGLLASATANAVVKVNSLGDGFEPGPTTTDIEQAEAKATEAAASATEAAASAANAGRALGTRHTFDDAVTASGISTGLLRFNNATVSSVTEIYVHDTDADAQDFSALGLALASGDGLRLIKADDVAKWAEFEISAVADNTTYITLTVSHTASGTAFSNADTLVLERKFAGVQGQAGGVNWTNVAWSTGQSYNVDDGVERNGSSYRVKQAHTSTLTDEPGVGASQATYWEVVAAKGDQGAQGTQGNAGVSGSDGENGGLELVLNSQPTSDQSSIIVTGLQTYEMVRLHVVATMTATSGTLSLEARSAGGTWRVLKDDIAFTKTNAYEIILDNLKEATEKSLLYKRYSITSTLDSSDAVNDLGTQDGANFRYIAYDEVWDEVRLVPSTGSFEFSTEDERGRIRVFGSKGGFNLSETLFEDSAPLDTQGKDGDRYVHEAGNFDYYKKVSGTWASPIGQLKGPKGDQGDAGADGNDGVSAGLKYQFNTSTTLADPGAGKILYNNATVSSVSKIAIDDATADTGNPDVSARLLTWDDSNNNIKGSLKIAEVGTPENFATFDVTGLTDQAGYVELDVSHIASSGTFATNDNLSVEFTASGDKGDDAGELYTFSTTTTMADPGGGSLRLNNASAASVTEIAIDLTSAATGNPDISSRIAQWDDSTNSVKGTLRIVDRANAANTFTFNLTSITAETGWRRLAVSGGVATGTMTNNADVVVHFTRSGDLGSANTIGKHTISVSANSAKSRTTNGAADGEIETTTNKANIETKDFDSASQEFIQVEFAAPKSFDLSAGLEFELYWSHASTTTNFDVRWGAQAQAQGNGDALDSAYGTAVEVTDTGGATDTNYKPARITGVTVAGTPAEGDIIMVQIYRDPTHAGDNLAVDARLRKIAIIYTTDDDTDD